MTCWRRLSDWHRAQTIKSDTMDVTLGEREQQTVDIKLAVPKSEWRF